jgi:predicted ATPase
MARGSSRRSEAEQEPTPSAEPYRGSFIGREADLESVAALLEGGARLVTLLGPGGVGKTRLLHRLYSVRRGADWVFCDLTSARTSGDVLTLVATALGGAALGAAATNAEASRRIGHAIARRRARCVLALDNLEQLEEAALPFLSEWLALAQRLVIVTTSRVRLGVPGEVVHRVGPLLLDSRDGPSEALRLFVDRARSVRGALSSDELASAERIAVLLEGIPLALEMAATRLCVLSPSELLDRLARPLAVLGDDDAGVADRHASLSRVLAGSWELLAQRDRQTVAELGVFVGGFTIEAAEAVLSVGADAFRALQRLVDSSLVRSVVTDRGHVRMLPYEVVREFALEQLACSNRLEELELRHTRYFAAFGAKAVQRIDSADGAPSALTDLLEDEANLSAAVAREDRGSPCRLELLLALEPVRMLRGQTDAWIDDVASTLSIRDREAEPASRLVTRMRLGLARVAHDVGRPTVALAGYERAIVEARALGDPSLAAWALAGLGRLLANRGEWSRCFALFGEAREVHGASPPVRAFVEACYQFYGAELDVTHGTTAIAAYVEFCRRGADPRELVFWLVQQGRAESELTLEEHAPARILREALDLARSLGDLRGEGYALFGWGSHRMIHGALAEAGATLREAAALLADVGTRRFAAWALGFLAITEALQGRFVEALSELERAIFDLHAVGDAPRECHLLAFRGAIHARLDDKARAEEDIARANVLVASESRYHRWTIDLCRRQLDVLAGRRAAARGELETAKRHFAQASDLLIEIGWPAPHDQARAWPWGGEFYEPRLAARLLEVALRDAATSTGALIVARDGSAFVLPSGDEVVVPGRGKLQRIIVALAEARADDQKAVPASRLIEAAWGNERMTRDAGGNRLHVALDSLRKLGLREVLLRGEGGWRFDPGVPFAWHEADGET